LNRAAGPVPVALFIEKPDPGKARDLKLNGALWNTMIMVCRAETLLRLASGVSPDLYGTFQRIDEALGTPAEKCVVREIYQQLAPVNFSKDLLEPYVQAHPSSLMAVSVRDVLWSDWGTESRVMEVLRRTGHVARLNGLTFHQPLSKEVAAAQAAAVPQISRAKQTSVRSKQRMMRLAVRHLS
jgi:mannose-1-phosphate guanylyltransferase